MGEGRSTKNKKAVGGGDTAVERASSSLDGTECFHDRRRLLLFLFFADGYLSFPDDDDDVSSSSASNTCGPQATVVVGVEAPESSVSSTADDDPHGGLRMLLLSFSGDGMASSRDRVGGALPVDAPSRHPIDTPIPRCHRRTQAEEEDKK